MLTSLKLKNYNMYYETVIYYFLRGLYGSIHVFSLSIIIFILGVLLPVIKRRICTEKVSVTLSPKKMKEHSFGNSPSEIETHYFSGMGMYFFNGKKYTARIKSDTRTSAVDIMFNPNNPKQFVYADKKNYYLCISISLIFALAALFIGISLLIS